MKNAKILVINGPNLNMLGTREPGVYGSDTLDSINSEIDTYAKAMNIECDFYQSNCEGELISKIHSLMTDYDGCVFNAGAYTHYSYAIRDAIASIGLPVVEVHLTNIHSREAFRHTSVTAPVCIGIIAGFGVDSYLLAVNALVSYLNKKSN